MENKENQGLDNLLKDIDSFLAAKDERVVKAKEDDDEVKDEKKEEKKEEKEEKSAKKAKDEDDKKEEKTEKGPAEGGEDNIGHVKDLPSDAAGWSSKKSFEASPEYQELIMLRKAEEDRKFETMNKSFSTLADGLSVLTKKVEEMSKAPVSEPKSVDGLKVLEKGVDTTKTEVVDNIAKSLEGMPAPLRKAKVANVLFEDGVKKGLLGAEDVAEYEFCGRIKDSEKRRVSEVIVRKALNEGTLV